MKCRVFDTSYGSVVCFIDSRFPDINIQGIFDNSDAVCTKIVFFDEIDVLPVLEQHEMFPGYIDVCLVGCASYRLLTQLRTMKNDRIVRLVNVSMCDIYSSWDFIDVNIGVERWEFFGVPNDLALLDQTAMTVNDIHRLYPYIDSIVSEILSYNPRDDVEKVLLLDIILQREIQYIKAKRSLAGDEVYVCETMERESQAEDVLLYHFGRCEDIAFTASVVLNHPRIGVPCHQVSVANANGFNHSWNMVMCLGRTYYVDFTHNITRNPDRVQGSLKAKSYYPQFTLLGLVDAKNKYGVSDVYRYPNISTISYNRAEINSMLKRFEKMGIELQWPDKLIKDSYSVSK